MAVVNAAGTVIAEGSFPATAYTDPDPVLVMTDDVYETFAFDGEHGHSGKRLLFREGDLVRTSDRDAAYPTATITAISPAAGPAAGGTAVTLTGTHLDGVTAGAVGGTAMTSVVVVNQTTVTAVTPAKTAGTYNVTLTDDSGTATLAAGFTTS